MLCGSQYFVSSLKGIHCLNSDELLKFYILLMLVCSYNEEICPKPIKKSINFEMKSFMIKNADGKANFKERYSGDPVFLLCLLENMSQDIDLSATNFSKTDNGSGTNPIILQENLIEVFSKDKENSTWEFIKYYLRKFFEIEDKLDYGFDFLVYLKLGEITGKFHFYKLNDQNIYLYDMLTIYRRKMFYDIKEKWKGLQINEMYQLLELIFISKYNFDDMIRSLIEYHLSSSMDCFDGDELINIGLMMTGLRFGGESFWVLFLVCFRDLIFEKKILLDRELV